MQLLLVYMCIFHATILYEYIPICTLYTSQTPPSAAHTRDSPFFKRLTSNIFTNGTYIILIIYMNVDFDKCYTIFTQPKIFCSTKPLHVNQIHMCLM